MIDRKDFVMGTAKPQMLLKSLIAPAVGLLLVAGLVLERQTWPQPKDADAYHARVAEAIRDVPEQIAGFNSEPVELPNAAVTLLRPNEILSRRYRDPQTGRSFQFLIVHCRDARDMVGHYPPRCYPNSGWEMIEHRLPTLDDAATAGSATWADRHVHYAFEQHLPGSSARLHVANLIVLPDGTFGQTMSDVNRIARNRQFRVYGAAQLQFVFHGDFSSAHRQEIVRTFTAAADEAIQAIRTGVEP